MAKSTNETDASDGKSAARGDLGQAEVQKKIDKINEQGFFGTETDPTPNKNYSVEGVTSGKPTPETDAKQRAKAREAATLP